MEFNYLIVTKDKGVGVVKINREDTMNSLCPELIRELYECFRTIAEDPELKVVVLTGGEKVFSAGMDMDMALSFNEDNKMELLDIGEEAYIAILKCKLPVIAAVSGPALAAGFDVMTMADVRIFSETAQVGQPEILWALNGFQDPLWKICGWGRAKELSLTGRIYGAQEALQIGLANYVYPVEGFMDKVMKYAARMARSDRRALITIKEQSNRVPGMEPEAAVRTQLWAFRNFAGGKAMRERMMAFRQSQKSKS